MDKTPDDGGGSTWIRDLFVRIRGTGGASPPRRLANAPHSTPATPRGERRIVSSGSGTIYFDAVPDLEVDRRVITPLGPNSDPEIGSTSAPGRPDQPPSSGSETLTKPECLPEPDANPTVVHPPVRPVCASAVTIPPGFERTWLEKTKHTYADVVSQPDSNLCMPLKQLREPERHSSLMHPLPVSAAAVAIPPGSPTRTYREEQVLSSLLETTDSEPEIIGDVIRLVRTAASVSRADVEQGLQRIISDFDVLPESEGTYEFIRRPRKAPVNVSGADSSAAKLERIAVQMSSDSSDFEVLSGPEESATYYASHSTAARLPPLDAEAVSETESSPSSSDATDSGDLSKRDRKDLSGASERAADASSDLGRTEISGSFSPATDSDDLFERDTKDLSDSVAANSSAGVSVEAEGFSNKGKGGKDSGGVNFTFGFKLNPNAKEFIPRAAANGGVFPVNSSQNLSAFREGVKLTSEELKRPPWIEGKAFSLFSSPGDSKLDLGTALRVNFQGSNRWTKWAPPGHSSPRPHSEVVWGSARRKRPSSSAPAVPNPVGMHSGNMSATPPWGRRDRAQHRRPHYLRLSGTHAESQP